MNGSIGFFICGGGLAIAMCFALDTYQENQLLKKKIEEQEKELKKEDTQNNGQSLS